MYVLVRDVNSYINKISFHEGRLLEFLLTFADVRAIFLHLLAAKQIVYQRLQ